MLLEADAGVLIGDVALRALYEAPAKGFDVVDLGQAWREWTGLPMVFAVWAVRRDFAAAHPGQVKDVHEAFLRSRDLCLAELDEVAEAAARWETFDAATLANYFRTLDFSLGERQVAGIREFARRAAALGEAPALPADGPVFASLVASQDKGEADVTLVLRQPLVAVTLVRCTATISCPRMIPRVSPCSIR